MFDYEQRRRIIAAFYPNCCPFCGKIIGRSDYFCEYCRKHIPYLYGKLTPPENISQLLACCKYSGGARRAVLSLKYGGLIYPADAFALMMSERLRGVNADLLVPVPSGFLSIKKRGFSTAKLLCKRISRRVGIPMLEAVRARDEKSEQKTLSVKKRKENARKNFYVAKNADIKGKRLILVDDVSTTGSSLSAVAGLLREAGAADVKAIVFAKTMLCTNTDSGILRLKKPKAVKFVHNK